MDTVTPEDLRAAVAAGILSEAQAVSVSTLAQGRAGQRSAMPAEDEPFEFFKGFSEIFVSIGLVIALRALGGGSFTTFIARVNTCLTGTAANSCI